MRLEVAETYSGVVPIYHDQVSREIDGLEFGYGYYQLFVYWVLSTTTHRSTVISFNHDLLLEHALEWSGFAYSQANDLFATPGDAKFNDPNSRLHLLKLHGSFNFVWCDRCRKINVAQDLIWQYGGEQCRLCFGRASAFYVPPLTHKDYSPFQPLWVEAAEALRSAERLVVIGYSFPEYDQMARSLVRDNLNRDAEVFLIDPYPSTALAFLTGLSNTRRELWRIAFRDALHIIVSLPTMVSFEPELI